MCLDDQILNTYLDGELTEPWKSQVEEHLSYCPSCRTRYQNLLSIKGAMKNAELSDEEIQPRMDRVLSMIEKNHLSKKKGNSFLRKTFKLTAPQLLGVAAAFVVVFVGSWAVFGGNGSSDNAIPLPDVNTSIDLTNITQTRSTDNATTSKSLENYSLDEILKNLDARGYDVDIRLKSIQPLSLEKISSDVRVIAKVKDKGITITSDGLARDAEGQIVATGVILDSENRIVASDGTVIFEADVLEIIPPPAEN
ncbi:MAG: zf-HC2 domain-containing protein [Spirochaetales bacterium]|jgi:anti-sigma factor ChrR (cupin superfamily)|nr:zf-HC2 domain-containing protein [Spirochaetales bacterium]